MNVIKGLTFQGQHQEENDDLMIKMDLFKSIRQRGIPGYPGSFNRRPFNQRLKSFGPSRCLLSWKNGFVWSAQFRYVMM